MLFFMDPVYDNSMVPPSPLKGTRARISGFCGAITYSTRKELQFLASSSS